MQIGEIRWISPKGYGFAALATQPPMQVYVPAPLLAGMREGQQVKVRVTNGVKGPMAEAVELMPKQMGDTHEQRVSKMLAETDAEIFKMLDCVLPKAS